MNFSCEEEYNAYCDAQGQAEAEMREQYYQYLGDLIKEGKYELHALEVALDLINEHYKESSGKTVQQFLIERKNRLNEPQKKQELDF